MKKQVIGTELICDGCGRVFESADGFVCYANDPHGTLIEEDADCSDWKVMEGDKHYCPECWKFESPDVIRTKDGRRWDENDEEIK